MLKVIFIKIPSNIYKGRILSVCAAAAILLNPLFMQSHFSSNLFLSFGGITMMIILSLLYTNVLSYKCTSPFCLHHSHAQISDRPSLKILRDSCSELRSMPVVASYMSDKSDKSDGRCI